MLIAYYKLLTKYLEFISIIKSAKGVNIFNNKKHLKTIKLFKYLINKFGNIFCNIS